MKVSSILGLNARSRLFLMKYNSRKAKKIADSKLIMYKVLKKKVIDTPEVFVKFKNQHDLSDFDFSKLPGAFAVKPSRGFGGEGIIVVKRALTPKSPTDATKAWITTQKQKITEFDIKLHVLDILEGAFSLGNIPDVAFIQEYVGRHKTFRKYSYRGTPDIRVIVFNKVPVMAMLRLPTKESGGRANLHQGALGVGIDIATGITTNSIQYGEPIIYKPDTKRKLRGIKIPMWEKVLELAVKCQDATGLGYLGVDIVLHPEKGPMVLEINARPGLQIQLANHAGLKKRLERVDELEVRSPDHGAAIAKALFSSKFSDKVKIKETVKTLKPLESVVIYTSNKKKITVTARIDTGATRTSIDRKLANELGLLTKSNLIVVKNKRYVYRSAVGLTRQKRSIIGLTLRLGGRKIRTSASVANREKLSSPLLIGRNDLAGFLVAPQEEA